ncbi:glutamate-1-semialdehyde 2,1-aminomutase [soil metagenome]
MTNSSKSEELFARAEKLIPGGVNSPVRAFKAVGGAPRFIARAAGSRIWDADGNELIDFVGSWGPMILGHGHPVVHEAIARQVEKGVSFGAPCELELRMAELITSAMPAVEMVRMVNSGTEATMSAIRLARAATGRELIVKFEGCYHGHGDAFLSKGGSGMATLGEPTSPGVPRGAAACTLNARFNDVKSVAEIFAAHDHEIAAVIVEPVAGNMGVVAPRDGFLSGLRELCTRHGALLIFDEVMTGFRVAWGGAQELYGVTPDLTTLGKIIGGGLPVGAYGGRRDLMKMISPSGPVYQAGTLSGNPLAMAAGLAQLEFLRANRGVYAELEKKSAAIEAAVAGMIAREELPATFARVGSMATLFFTATSVRSWDEAKGCDTGEYARYFHALLNSGIYMPPAQFEAFFIGAAHSDEDVRLLVDGIAVALR